MAFKTLTHWPLEYEAVDLIYTFQTCYTEEQLDTLWDFLKVNAKETH